jgi:hypothetical protein
MRARAKVKNTNILSALCGSAVNKAFYFNKKGLNI